MVSCNVSRRNMHKIKFIRLEIPPSIKQSHMHAKIFQRFFCLKHLCTPRVVKLLLDLLLIVHAYYFLYAFFLRTKFIAAVYTAYKRNTIVKPSCSQIIIRHCPRLRFRFPSNTFQRNLFWYGMTASVPFGCAMRTYKRFIWLDTL